MRSLILHNLKKSKGQFISFGIVMLITAAILNTALVLLFQTGNAYDQLFSDLNAADISVTIPTALSDQELVDELSNLKDVTDINTNKALFASATLQDFQDSEFTMNTFFYPISEERDLSKVEVVDSIDTTDQMQAYIPQYLSELGGYEIGEMISYIIDGQKYNFIISGIVNEMEYGNYGTGFIGLYLSEKAYESIENDKNFLPVTDYLIKTQDLADLQIVKDEVVQVLSDKGISTISFLDRETTKDSRIMVSSVIVLFLAVFALLVLIVSIFLARFKIKNTIDEEINEMGVLKGLGYTSKMIMLSQIIPYLIISGIGVALGVGLSYTFIPAVANVLAVQSGFSYTPVFDISAATLTIILILVAILLFTLLASKKIRRLEPINAIRGIDPTRPITKNHFPLDSTKGPIGFNMILKQSSTSIKQNILLFIVTFAMMILLTFSGVLLYNVNFRPNNFLTTLSEELPDIRVQSDSEHFEDLKKVLEDENVKYVNYGLTATDSSEGSIPLIVSEDYSLLENDILYEGRHPETGDEIAIGSDFSNDYNIGDTFTLTQNDQEHQYTVTGYIQSINNNGQIAEVTDQGYTKISDTPLYSLNLYLENKEDINGFVDKLNTDYDDLTVNVNNAARDTESMQKLYSSLITVVVAILFIVAVLIVLLILYVVMHSMITNLKTDFGIYKAMGFTSRQLIIRTVGSIVPVVLLAALLSAVLGIFYLPAMYNGIFSVIGAIKNNFEIPLLILLLLAIILTVVNIIIGVILCLPIKRITAYSLIKE